MLRRVALFILLLVVAAVAVLAIVVTRYPAIRIDRSVEGDVSPGYVLFAPTADDLGFEPHRNSIYLMNMEGKVVHTWTVLGAVQLARLMPDGNLFYSTRDLSFRERAGVREIDPFGNVLWFYNIWVDHDFEVLESGNLLIHYVEDSEAPAVGQGVLRNPRMIEVTRDKEVVWEWRGEDHVRELAELAGVNFPLPAEGLRAFDWAHSNTAQVIPENLAGDADPRFRTGNILISYPNLNTIAVVDRDSGDIVWAWGPGQLDGQHNPRMTMDGLIVVFDNGTERGHSRVLEMDPLTGEIVWEYSDPGRFYSAFVSNAQPLGSGNVFVCQGSGAAGPWDRLFLNACRLVGSQGIVSRFFEVARGGEVVWDCRFAARGPILHNVYQAHHYPPPDVRALLDRIESGDTTTRRLESLPYVR
jgi:hypothetical protein